MQQAEEFRRRKEEGQRLREEEELARRQEAERLQAEQERREAEERRRIEEFYRRLEQEAEQRERRAEWRMRRNNPGIKAKRRELQQEMAHRRWGNNSTPGRSTPVTVAAESLTTRGGRGIAVTNVQITTDVMGNFVVKFRDGEGNELEDNLEEIFNTLDTELQNRLATGSSFDQLPVTVRSRICHALEFKMVAAAAGNWQDGKTACDVTPTHAVPSRAENRQLNTQSSLGDWFTEGEGVGWTGERKDSNGNNEAEDETVQTVQNSQFYSYDLSLFAGSGSGTIIPDPNTDPGKSSGSMRIRNTASSAPGSLWEMPDSNPVCPRSLLCYQ